MSVSSFVASQLKLLDIEKDVSKHTTSPPFD